MKQKRLLMLAAILIIICGTCVITCCSSEDNPAVVAELAFVPDAPDYSDSTMWVTEDDDAGGTGADVFYVVSTWEEDWTTADGAVSHYADVWNPVHRDHMATEMHGVAAYMSPGNRFFAPYYRHTTIDAWVTQNEDTIQQRTRLAMADVCAAFDHFQQQRDPSRPLIITGFSQGGMAVVELLKHISDETYSQLAAATVPRNICHTKTLSTWATSTVVSRGSTASAWPRTSPSGPGNGMVGNEDDDWYKTLYENYGRGCRQLIIKSGRNHIETWQLSLRD